MAQSSATVHISGQYAIREPRAARPPVRTAAARFVLLIAAIVSTTIAATPVSAQQQAQPAPGPARPAAPTQTPDRVGVQPSADYVIGPEDVLEVVFWRDKDMSAQVVVRPDGKISLPLLNDVQASGLTPSQLRTAIQTEAQRYVEDPNVTIVIRQINSRKVFVTGQVGKPGSYPLTGPTTVLQMIAMAGGLTEFADKENIVVMRFDNGKQASFRFNFKDVMKRKNIQQNIELRPGDTIVVP